MVPHWLKIAIQTLQETENMANTGPLYRLFNFLHIFFRLKAMAKKAKSISTLSFPKCLNRL